MANRTLAPVEVQPNHHVKYLFIFIIFFMGMWGNISYITTLKNLIS